MGLKQKSFEVLNNKNLTEVEKQSQFLEEGNILQFFKEFEGIKRGENYEVKTEKDKDGVMSKFVVDSNGKKTKLDKNWAKDYNVYSKNKIELSLNDKIRITQNGKDRHNQELLNGQDLTITGELSPKISKARNTIYPKTSKISIMVMSQPPTAHKAKPAIMCLLVNLPVHFQLAIKSNFISPFLVVEKGSRFIPITNKN